MTVERLEQILTEKGIYMKRWQLRIVVKILNEKCEEYNNAIKENIINKIKEG